MRELKPPALTPSQHARAARYVWDATTNVGAVHQHNEDSWTVEPDRGLFVVCDGMGGHASGEVASVTACTTIREWVAARPPSHRLHITRELLVGAIHEANRRVFRLGNGPWRPGTTVAAMLWRRDQIVVAHVGDSRVYRLREGALVQLTRDHSLVNEHIDRGLLRPEEAADFPRKHIITRAVGTHSDVEVDAQVVDVAAGDVFLLASDGLEVLGPREVRMCLELPPTAAVERLIVRSVAKRAPDDVTVIVARAGVPDEAA
jgi:serine/threonine protein phosphatase PrpC